MNNREDSAIRNEVGNTDLEQLTSSQRAQFEHQQATIA